MIYDHCEDKGSEIRILKDNPDVGEVTQLCFSDLHVQTLKPACTKQETTSIRGQLELCSRSYAFARVFRSFLVEYDDQGIINEVWGCLSTTAYPDSYIFRLV